MKRMIIVFILLIMIMPLHSFEFGFINFEEMIYLSPFSHYSSIEGLREKNSFELNFNGISLINPITGETFITPSSLLLNKIELNNDFTEKIDIFSDNGNKNSLGFIRDGFSLKSEKTTDITNSLYLNYGKNKFHSLFIISNYGNTYTHFKDSFIGPGIETYLNWKQKNLNLNFYMNLKKNNDSVYPLDEIEQSEPIKFSDDAKASSFKKFIGGALNYLKKTRRFSINLLSSFSYGSYSQKGKNSSYSSFDSENSLWGKNYPRNFETGFFNFKNHFYFTKKDKNIALKFSLKFDYTSANNSFGLPENGIIYDESLKVDNYGYDFSIHNLNILPSIDFKIGGDKGFFVETIIGYNMFHYNIKKHGENINFDSTDYSDKSGTKTINLSSFDYTGIISYKGEQIDVSAAYSSFSKPLNLIKLMYLSNNFTPYFLYSLEEGEWRFQNSILSSPYFFNESKKFNRISRLKFNIKYQNEDNLTLGFSVVSDKMNCFWDRRYSSENINTFIVGMIEKNDDILFSPERKYTGINFSVKKSFEKDFLNAGITYMISKGNYNNEFNSVLSNYAYSNLFLESSVQQKFIENYKLTYGNGLKIYFYSNIFVSENINLKLYFVHMPPLNMIDYKIGSSSFGILPDSVENTSKSLNLLSLGLGYKSGKIKFFIGLKNILNSTPVMFKNGVDNTPLIKYPGFSTFIGINYSL